jgi:hypothetical protein
MPIGFVVPKPVPVTVTVPPGAWAFVFNVIAGAAYANGVIAIIIDRARKIMVILAHIFVVFCMPFTPLFFSGVTALPLKQLLYNIFSV